MLCLLRDWAWLLPCLNSSAGFELAALHRLAETPAAGRGLVRVVEAAARWAAAEPILWVPPALQLGGRPDRASANSVWDEERSLFVAAAVTAGAQ